MLSLSFIFYRDRKNIYAIIIYRGKLSKRSEDRREGQKENVERAKLRRKRTKIEGESP